MTRLGITCAVVGLMRAWASMTARQSGGSVRGFRDRRGLVGTSCLGHVERAGAGSRLSVTS